MKKTAYLLAVLSVFTLAACSQEDTQTEDSSADLQINVEGEENSAESSSQMEIQVGEDDEDTVRSMSQSSIMSIRVTN